MFQNLQYIEDSNRSSPINQDSLNNGYISGTVSPSRTPHSNDQSAEEKITLLGVPTSSNEDQVHGS